MMYLFKSEIGRSLVSFYNLVSCDISFIVTLNDIVNVTVKNCSNMCKDLQ